MYAVAPKIQHAFSTGGATNFRHRIQYENTTWWTQSEASDACRCIPVDTVPDTPLGTVTCPTTTSLPGAAC
jgi:hypothetical protein